METAKTRYATEFFQSIYPAERVRPYVRALSRLQDELSWMDDASVAATLGLAGYGRNLNRYRRHSRNDPGLLHQCF